MAYCETDSPGGRSKAMIMRVKMLKLGPGSVSVLKNETGSAMVLALMILSVLTILGVTAVKTGNTELQIAGNHYMSVAALYAAESGAVEAIERLRGESSDANYVGDPAANSDQWWSAYLLSKLEWQPASDDSDYDNNYQNYIPTTIDHTNTTVSANSLQSDMSYLVKIRHKREYEAEQAGHTVASNHYYDGDGGTSTHSAAAPGNILYYGYGDPANPTTVVKFTTGAATDSHPVEIITAYGSSSNYQGQSTQKIEVEAVRNPGPPINAALYAKGDVTGNGSSMNINGSDNCGVSAAKPPVYTMDPSVLITNGAPTLDGNPPTAQTGTDDIDIDTIVDQLKDSATQTLTVDQNGGAFGTSTDFVTIYSDPSDPLNINGLKLQNVTGYGLLLVEGDLVLGGGFAWNGIILVTGTLTFNGGGSGINVAGAVLANQTVDVNGNVFIQYDSCMKEKALNALGMQIVSWRKVY